jgi:hypothetical protein
LGNALLNRLEQTLAPVLPTVAVSDSGSVANGAASLPPAFTNTQKKQLRQQALQAYIATGEKLDIPIIAQQFEVSEQTIYRDLKDLQEQMAYAD